MKLGTAEIIIIIIALVIVGYGAVKLSRFLSRISRHIDRHLDDDAGQKPSK